MGETTTKPWHWCDRRCERCPIAADCELYERSETNRAHLEAQGIDPTDPTAQIAILELLAEELTTVVETAEEPPCPPPDRERFSEAGMTYAEVVGRLCERASDTCLAEEAWLVATIVAAKTVRIGADLPPRPDGPCRQETVMNLLLIDELERQSAALILALYAERGPASIERFIEVRSRLRALLDPHLVRLEERDRRALSELKSKGRAPSPFCVTTPRSRPNPAELGRREARPPGGAD